MRAEPVLAEPEHAVAGLERGHARAERLDDAGELAAEDRHLRLRQAGEEPDDPRMGGAEATVGAVHGRRVDPDEHLAVAGDR